MKWRFQSYKLHFKYPFRIAHGMRENTDAVFIELEQDGIKAYGEATLPPYLNYTSNDVIQFFNSVLPSLDFSTIHNNPESVFDQMEMLHKGNYPAKAAIDMAVWAWWAAKKNIKLQFNFENKNTMPYCTYTIGVSNATEMQAKLNDASAFKIIKLKLDGVTDFETLDLYEQLCDKPFAIDGNQSWQSLAHAEKILSNKIMDRCVLIEQPFNTTNSKDTISLRSITNIPIIADEAFQTQEELDSVIEIYDGINIKLMKCGGISSALKIIKHVKEKNKRILIGCMSESACGCAAAASLQSYADWVDLDGPYLINNDPFDGYKIIGGIITTQYNQGTGVSTILFKS